jgi:hypothetical protein
VRVPGIPLRFDQRSYWGPPDGAYHTTGYVFTLEYLLSLWTYLVSLASVSRWDQVPPEFLSVRVLVYVRVHRYTLQVRDMTNVHTHATCSREANEFLPKRER